MQDEEGNQNDQGEEEQKEGNNEEDTTTSNVDTDKDEEEKEEQKIEEGASQPGDAGIQNKSDGEQTTGSEPVAETDTAWSQQSKRLLDKECKENEYFNPHEFTNLKEYVVDYKKVLQDWQQLYDKEHRMDYEVAALSQLKVEYKKFLSQQNKSVNYMVKEFEMKKSAAAYARTKQDKTGIINPLKLHSYKFNEDIFKKMSNIPNQKNHGMIFLLDWSGSMQRHIMPTTEQLLNLVMFCRKINIPFSVYKFVNNSDGYISLSERRNKKHTNHRGAPFVLTDNTPQCDQTTKLVQLFSHKQSKSDFKRSAQNIYRSALYFGDYYDYRRRMMIQIIIKYHLFTAKYYMSSTPLNESLIAMDNIIAKFKSDYKTEKVALVTLTDGSSNSISTSGGNQMMIKLGNKYHKCEYGCRDEKKI